MTAPRVVPDPWPEVYELTDETVPCWVGRALLVAIIAGGAAWGAGIVWLTGRVIRR